MALLVVTGFLPLSVAIADRWSTSISIAVKTKLEKSTHPGLENIFLVQESAAKKPLLRMVQIRTTSSRGLKQLRAMHLDIVRVSPDPDRALGEELFSSWYIVEAVVTKGELAKLKKKGFDVSEMPEKN